MKQLRLMATALAAWLAALPLKAANLQDAFGDKLETVGSGIGYDTGQRSIEPIIGNIITVVLSFLGVIFLAIVIYAGISWMTAMGNDAKIKRAKDFMQAAIIGLIIVVAAYAVTYLVIFRLTSNLLVETGL
jgi:hypothetical protein